MSNRPAPSSSSSSPSGPESSTTLKRGISPLLLLLFVVGDMVGGGIYALVGKVADVTGGAIWTAFLAALVLALITAFAYAELVTKYPRAGGAAFYVHRAVGWPLVSFLVAFVVVMSGITSASALAKAFGDDYLQEFVRVPTLVSATLFLLAAAWINHRGITESVTVNAIFTVIEIGGLLLIVAIGVAAILGGTGDPGRVLEFKPGTGIPWAIVAGTGLSFYALIGFEDSVNVAEETENPGRTFPIALFGGIAVAGTIYLLVTILASIVVPTDQLAGSSAALLEVVKAGPLNVPPKFFAGIGLFALANGALINMIMASRLIYGMSQEGVLPAFLSRVHSRRKTPTLAIVFSTLVALGLVVSSDISDLARTTVHLLLLAFIAVNVSVLVLRKDKVEHSHFRAPLVFPILGILTCVAMLTQQKKEIWWRAGALLLLGLVLYGLNLLVKRQLDRTRNGSS